MVFHTDSNTYDKDATGRNSCTLYSDLKGNYEVFS